VVTDTNLILGEVIKLEVKMEKKVKVGNKEYTIKEIKYIDALELDETNRSATAKQLLKKSAGLTDEEIGNLTIQEGLELQEAINEVNGLNKIDFRKPTVENPK